MKFFVTIGSGKVGVLFLVPLFVTKELKRVIDELNVKVSFITQEYYDYIIGQHPKENTKIGCVPTLKCLEKAVQNVYYTGLMNEIREVIAKNGVNYVYSSLYLLHPLSLNEFTRTGIKTVLGLSEDPNASLIISKPLLNFCWTKIIVNGVNYDKSGTIKEKVESWGGKNVKFLPNLFINPAHYDYIPIDYAKKDIDIIFVGSLNWLKWKRLSQLYKTFGNQLHIYSKYDPRKGNDWKSEIYCGLNEFYPLPQIRQASEVEVKSLYKRAKIGFNLHLSYGPSNVRSYELCLNGVMQVADNYDGYKSLYEVGKEIICYDKLDEAIILIKHYLQKDVERTKIAKAGYNKAMNYYTFEKVFKQYMEYILT